jgi:protein-disulfide isomerase
VAVGLADQAGFNQCLDTDKYAGLVLEEKRRGERLGVNSTPTLFVNGRRVVLSNSRSPVESIRVAVQNASTR